MVYRVDVKHVSHFLKEVDIFQGLSERHLDRVSALCEERSFRAGEVLGVYNEPGSSLYIVRRGEIAIIIGSEEQNAVVRPIRERETSPVAVMLEPPLLVATAKAATDGEAYVIPRVRLLELCELEPRIGMHVYRAACNILMTRYRYTLKRLAEFVGPTVEIDPTWKGAEV